LFNMSTTVQKEDIFGFVRPSNDAHALGTAVVGKLLEDCGYKVLYGDARVNSAVAEMSKKNNIETILHWIKFNRITRLGFSYRLSPGDAQFFFGKMFYALRQANMFVDQGGPLKQIYFAGLPEACTIIRNEYKDEIPVFMGDETQLETLLIIGVPAAKIPAEVTQSSKYDIDRMQFAKELIRSGSHFQQKPPRRSFYDTYGTRKDSLVERIHNNKVSGDMPLIRVHAGPYNPNHADALKEFKEWLKILSVSGYLDVVSIGSSQLSQSNFGEDWGGKPNGGGVPINSEQDLLDIWEASRPMLVRTYAGTRNIVELAKIYEGTINIAWHALSLWWFNQIDGRGSYTVRENLEQHFLTMGFISNTGKPFEPNVPHHFAFRGSDDYSYVLSGYLAAKAAKRLGISHLILQTMLNTPKNTWGVQDIAKARSLFLLVKELEDTTFKVYLQPRAGLDYFSPDLEKARIQLAAVSAMMDDIVPEDSQSPEIMHVVSFCEAVHLATPKEINESIQIALKALVEYREAKKIGAIQDTATDQEIALRTQDLYSKVKSICAFLEKKIENLYSPEGFYYIFKKGVLPLPYLWEQRDEFHRATTWKTALCNGSMQIVGADNKPLDPLKRVKDILS
jgi:hypothetical protein